MQQHLPLSEVAPLATTANPYDPPSDYGRPLDLLLEGGAVALGTMGAILVLAYKCWYADQIAENTAVLLIGFLFFIYTGGVWIFSYGWCKRDQAKAMRLTAVIVVFSAVAVLIVGVALSMLRSAPAAGEEEEATSAGGGAGNLGGVLRTAASYVDDGALHLVHDEARSELNSVACEHCGEHFIPLPPKALCPFCGWSAVAETTRLAASEPVQPDHLRSA